MPSSCCHWSPHLTWPSYTLIPPNRQDRGRGTWKQTPKEERWSWEVPILQPSLQARGHSYSHTCHDPDTGQRNTSYPAFRVLQRAWVYTISSHLLCLWRLASWLEWGYRWDGARGIMEEAVSLRTAHSSVALQATSVESIWTFKQGSLQTSKQGHAVEEDRIPNEQRLFRQ